MRHQCKQIQNSMYYVLTVNKMIWYCVLDENVRYKVLHKLLAQESLYTGEKERGLCLFI